MKKVRCAAFVSFNVLATTCYLTKADISSTKLLCLTMSWNFLYCSIKQQRSYYLVFSGIRQSQWCSCYKAPPQFIDTTMRPDLPIILPDYQSLLSPYLVGFPLGCVLRTDFRSFDLLQRSIPTCLTHDRHRTSSTQCPIPVCPLSTSMRTVFRVLIPPLGPLSATQTAGRCQ